MNVCDVRILDEVADDLERGKALYNANGRDAGCYFIDCLMVDIASLKLYAGIHAYRFGFQRMLSKRFPYALYYEIEADCATVIAVLDMRQNPRSTERVLSQRSGN